MANEHADGPTTLKMKDADLLGSGKIVEIGPKWTLKKIQLKRNETGEVELNLTDKVDKKK